MLNDFLWKVPWPEVLDAFGLTPSLPTQQQLPGHPELGPLSYTGYLSSPLAQEHSSLQPSKPRSVFSNECHDDMWDKR